MFLFNDRFGYVLFYMRLVGDLRSVVDLEIGWGMHWVVVEATGACWACVWASGTADATPSGRASRLLDCALTMKINENTDLT